MILEFGKWLIQFGEDWTQFFQACNWYTFRIVNLEIEDDAMLGTYEMSAVFLGLSVRICYLYDDDTEGRRDINQQLAEFDTD